MNRLLLTHLIFIFLSSAKVNAQNHSIDCKFYLHDQESDINEVLNESKNITDSLITYFESSSWNLKPLIQQLKVQFNLTQLSTSSANEPILLADWLNFTSITSDFLKKANSDLSNFNSKPNFKKNEFELLALHLIALSEIENHIFILADASNHQLEQENHFLIQYRTQLRALNLVLLNFKQSIAQSESQPPTEQDTTFTLLLDSLHQILELEISFLNERYEKLNTTKAFFVIQQQALLRLLTQGRAAIEESKLNFTLKNVKSK